jgi:hypothetical protein
MPTPRAPEVSVRRLLFRLAFPFIILSLGLAAFFVAVSILRERRAVLLAHAEHELTASAKAVATLVSDRGHDIRSDLILATEVRKHAQQSPELRREIIRSHLISLNRSAKHYLRLWYFEDGELTLEISGYRTSPKPVPDIPLAEVAEIDRRARERPGTMAGVQALVPIDSPYDSLRLLGVAPREGDATVVVLVNMDAVFDALQSRASLPGIDLLFVDLDM